MFDQFRSPSAESAEEHMEDFGNECNVKELGSTCACLSARVWGKGGDISRAITLLNLCLQMLPHPHSHAPASGISAEFTNPRRLQVLGAYASGG